MEISFSSEDLEVAAADFLLLCLLKVMILVMLCCDGEVPFSSECCFSGGFTVVIPVRFVV